MRQVQNRLMLLVMGFAALVCLAVLVNIGLHARELTAHAGSEPEIIKARRGTVFDRSGLVLAASSRDGKRYYPSGLCAHALGTVSPSGEAQSGIELALDSSLRGRDGIITEEESRISCPGADVYLTIDSRIQTAAESVLETAARNYAAGVDYDTEAPYSGSAGAVVVLDCKSGEVLALASYPDFDPKSFARDYEALAADEASPLLDRACQGLYRPGSSMKTVTAAAALSEGAISADTRFYCGSALTVSGTRFSCMNAHGYIDVRQALSVSCNIFFYQASRRLGIAGLLEYQRLFGFGEAPEFELPTSAGQLASPENVTPWSDAQLVQAAIGQSATLCTPLQMARCAMILAEHGNDHPLTLVRGIGTRSSAESVLRRRPERRLPASPVFGIIKEGMVSSAQYTHGEFALSQLPEPCAIKTGTPQSPRGYDSTVLGFYPADDPQIAFAIMLEGGANAKHAVFPLVQAAIQ